MRLAPSRTVSIHSVPHSTRRQEAVPIQIVDTLNAWMLLPPTDTWHLLERLLNQSLFGFGKWQGQGVVHGQYSTFSSRFSQYFNHFSRLGLSDEIGQLN